MQVNTARRLLAQYTAIAAQRPLTKYERSVVLNLRATIRRATGNHFAA